MNRKTEKYYRGPDFMNHPVVFIFGYYAVPGYFENV